MEKLLAFLVLCLASVNCVELENICSSDSFHFNGVLVNAFQKIGGQVRFEGLSHYLINDTILCDPSEFRNKSNYWEVLKIKSR